MRAQAPYDLEDLGHMLDHPIARLIFSTDQQTLVRSHVAANFWFWETCRWHRRAPESAISGTRVWSTTVERRHSVRAGQHVVHVRCVSAAVDGGAGLGQGSLLGEVVAAMQLLGVADHDHALGVFPGALPMRSRALTPGPLWLRPQPCQPAVIASVR